MAIIPASTTPNSAEPFRQAMISSESGRTRLIQYSIAIVTLVLVMAPTLPIIYQSFIDKPIYDSARALTFQNYLDIITNERIGWALVNTLILAFASTLIGQVIGVVCAILLGRTDVPGRGIFSVLVMAPLFISHLVLAFGWSMIYGPSGYITMWAQALTGTAPWQLYSLAGMSLVAGIAQAPLAIIYCLSSTALADGNLEDAARSCGASGLRTLRSITLPLLRPAIIYSSVLNFTAALEMLSIPLLFGEPVRISFLSSLLYMEGIAAPRPNYGLVATAAVVLLLIVSALVYLQGKLLKQSRRFETVGGKASRRRQFRLGKARWIAFAVLAVYATLFIILPVGVLMLRSVVQLLTPLIPIWDLFTLSNYAKVFSTPTDMRALTNTLVVATVGAGVATLFIALITIVVHKSQFRFRRELEYVAMLPRAIPGLIAGIGFFYAVALIPPLGWLRNTTIIIVIAYTMRYIPTAFGALAAPLMQLAPDLNNSARVMGADWWTATRAVTLPLIRPAMFSCFALLFIQFLKEYSTAIFLFAPGSEVIGPTLLQYWENGETGSLAALAVIQVSITIVFIFALQRLLKVRIYD